MKNVYEFLVNKKSAGKKSLAVLIDPDKTQNLDRLLDGAQPDLFLVGGSLLNERSTSDCITRIKKKTNAPVFLFPGNEMQIVPEADGVLLLSLISGRNPEFLIGRHVAAAGMIRASKLEVIPTGYILVESGSLTAVNYMSNTLPVPRNSNGIAAMTALAGEQLGMKLIYLEAGSGAEKSVPLKMISAVKKNISVPLIVGGGLRTIESIAERFNAGADMVVVGNILEEQPDLLESFCKINQVSQGL